MSGVWGWFGGGAAKKKDTPKNAILGLREQLEMLQKRERHLMSQVDAQDAIARKNVNTNKNAALAALKRKKLHEHSLSQTLASIQTLEQQINAIESANINKETLAAMQRAGEAMKQIHGKLTVDKVDEVMENLREQTELSEEIVNVINNNNLTNDILDVDELEEELAELQQEALDKQMLESGSVPVSAVPKLPNVANTELTKPLTEDEEEEELRKLQAEMAM
ncbi:vacuolar-sorting protein SNF7 [Xylariaceae sp. FL0594]|nr:vacuolar-sorting protein SNF7 [Xylariaceae sp. FL0594]